MCCIIQFFFNDCFAITAVQHYTHSGVGGYDRTPFGNAHFFDFWIIINGILPNSLIRMNLISIFEIVAFIAGLIAYKTIKPTFLKPIVFLLAITVLNEYLVIPYLVSFKKGFNNYGYNVFSFIDMATWFYLFYKINTKPSIRYFIITGAIVSLSYSFIELTFLKDWRQLHTDSFRVYELIIIFLSTYYFYQVMLKQYHNIFGDSIFWLCAGCFLLHLILFINLTMLNNGQYWNLKSSSFVQHILQNIAIFCYYCCITIAFVSCYYSKYLETKQKSRQVLYK